MTPEQFEKMEQKTDYEYRHGYEIAPIFKGERLEAIQVFNENVMEAYARRQRFGFQVFPGRLGEYHPAIIDLHGLCESVFSGARAGVVR